MDREFGAWDHAECQTGRYGVVLGVCAQVFGEEITAEKRREGDLFGQTKKLDALGFSVQFLF